MIAGIRAWWHRTVWLHDQDPTMNDGYGPPRIVCWCRGRDHHPTVWKA